MARKKSPEKKDQIRKAAIRVISKVGFYNCTTDRIAQEAGVSVGTIYNYFKDKENILSYIFEVEQKKLHIYFRKLNKKNIVVPEKIKYLIKEYFDFIYKHRDLFQILNDEINKPVRGLKEEIFNYGILIHKYIKEILVEGCNKGSIRENIDIDMMAYMMLSSANSVAHMGFLNPESIEDIFDRAAENVYKFFQNGIFT
ncbi:TetR/AcrR family transcriptional regulator [Natronospora cellulosivora (SeqCode)]